MPKMPPRPCTHARCRQYQTKDGRCDKHQREPWATDKSRHERGYGNAWDKLRKKVLERDHYLCKVCDNSGILTKGNQVDHILNKKRGGSDDMGNLQTICEPCHNAKTSRERHE